MRENNIARIQCIYQILPLLCTFSRTKILTFALFSPAGDCRSLWWLCNLFGWKTSDSCPWWI